MNQPRTLQSDPTIRPLRDRLCDVESSWGIIKEAREEIDRLRAENAKLTGYIDKQADEIARLRDENERLRGFDPCPCCDGLGFVSRDNETMHPESNVAWLTRHVHANGRVTWEGPCIICKETGQVAKVKETK